MVVVGTPIGNLGDLSPRAAEALERGDVIACEDTRRTRKLLNHIGRSSVPMVVVNDHTEDAATAGLIDRAANGAVVVLVSDAGMPTVSDPGVGLVAAAVEAGVRVEVVPGPSAVSAALAVSAMATGRYCFEGFLPRKGTARAARLRSLVAEERTTVIFESPHRLARTLADLAEALGAERGVVVARELTKLHEELWRGTAADGARWAADHARGECVIVVAGAEPPGEVDDADIERRLQERSGEALGRRALSAAIAAELGVSKRRVYELSLRWREA